jgi:hypothetical protein
MAKPHWLSPAGKTRSPDVVLSFDTETNEVDAGDHSVQRLRCWDVVQRVRHRSNGRRDLVLHHRGESASTLADTVEGASEGVKEVWVIAHNLAFDIAVSSLPFVLCERGWYLDSLHLGDESSWWVLTEGTHKIIITDSWSWLRCSLADAAKDIGRRKSRLPKDADDLSTWHQRCRRDAEILDELMVTLMNWWDENDLGVFGITGAACGWRTLRRHIAPRRLLVGADGERTKYERRAIHSGRKEVYGVGEFHDTWIADYDFDRAYNTAVAAFQLPLAPSKTWCLPDQLLVTPLPPQRDYIAEVEITTHRPCAPVKIGDETWWPVGTFRTTLAGPEIRYCQEVADEVRVLSYVPYRLGYALAGWAAWCLDLQTDTSGSVPPVVARVAKGWGRSVTGRFASRTSHVVRLRPSTHLGWHLESGHDLDSGASVEFLSIGGIERTIVKDQDGADVFPAVLAFVESHVRVALGRMLDQQPPELLLQCNTDGWWQTRAPRASRYVPDDIPWPFTITRKALERSLLVRGPNHVMSPHERRYAGIPEDATEGKEGAMHWRDWPGLRWQMEHGIQGEYHRPDASGHLSEHYVKRWVLDSGETIPVTARVDVDSETLLEPFGRSWGVRDADVLANYQVPTLQNLLTSDTQLSTASTESLPTQPGRDFPTQPRFSFLRKDLTEYEIPPIVPDSTLPL